MPTRNKMPRLAFPTFLPCSIESDSFLKKRRVVNITENGSSTLLIVPKSVDLAEAEKHCRDWCKKTFAEYLVEFKGAKVIEVENYSTKKQSPVYRSEAPGHGNASREV